MVNPYFNAQYYLNNNPDVAAVVGLSSQGAWDHYVAFGANEGRQPTPWFDSQYYLANNPDLIDAGLTVADLFSHFTTFGINEGRAPSANAILTETNLLAYAKANPDLLAAFEIDPAATTLTDAQQDQLANQFYAFGYEEGRPAAPFADTASVGETYVLTNAGNVITGGVDVITGTVNDDTFLALAANSLSQGDLLDGNGGNDVLTIAAGAAVAADAVTIKNIETINNASAGLNLANVTGANLINTTVAAAAYTNANLATVFAAQGNGAFAFSVDYAGALAGKADVAHVAAVNDGTALTATLTSADAAAIEGVTVTSNGTAANIVNLAAFATGNGLTSIVVDGAANTTIAGVGSTGLTSFDASAATGAVSFTTVAALASAATVLGGSGNDTLSLASATKAVTLDAGAGNDTITTGAGNDVINAGAGNDIVNGSAGADTITLGAGNDVVVYSAVNQSQFVAAGPNNTLDIITDFKADGADVLQFTAAGSKATTLNDVATLTSLQTVVDGLASTATLGDALAFITAGNSAVGTVSYFQFQGNTYVVVDSATAGFGAADDMVIQLTGHVDLGATDFSFVA